MLCLLSCAGMHSLFTPLSFGLAAVFIKGTTLKHRHGGVVRQCVKGGPNKMRMPTPTVPLARPKGLSIPAWQWTLLWSCSRLVFRPARGLILGLLCLLPWGVWGLTARFGTVPAPLPQLLGLWVPFWIDCLAFCCHTMPVYSFDDYSILL